MKKLSPPTNIPERPIFSGFDIKQPWQTPSYRRNLPHLRITGATYFVTFRLADSIPKIIAEKWEKERSDWLQAHGINQRSVEKNLERWSDIYFAIPTNERHAFEREQQRRFFIELDKFHGSCLLEQAQAHKIVAESLEFFHGQRIWSGDYVVVPNHVHILVQPFPGVELEEWLYSIKRFTSAKICKNISLKANKMMRQGHLWQLESFDHIVRSREELGRIRRYIANNPAKLPEGTFALKQMEWLDEFARKSDLKT